MQLYAPAKINLSLEIKGRRDDGFHEIETLMAPVSLSDRLTIERNKATNGIQFSCNDSSVPSGEDNLVVQAARLFQKATKSGTGIEIALEKRIPHGAGLGGGGFTPPTHIAGGNLGGGRQRLGVRGHPQLVREHQHRNDQKEQERSRREERHREVDRAPRLVSLAASSLDDRQCRNTSQRPDQEPRRMKRCPESVPVIEGCAGCLCVIGASSVGMTLAIVIIYHLIHHL
jgi:hypothetical protein